MAGQDACVTIVGAGVAGCATALALHQLGVGPLAVLHRPEAHELKAGETLHPQSRELLYALGLLQAVEEGPHLGAFGIASAWGHTELLHQDHIFSPYGKGWLLDRVAFDTMLREQVVARGIELIEQPQFEAAQRTAEGWQWTLEDGRRLTSRFAVDATGRRGALLRPAGGEQVVFDDLHAVYSFWEGTPKGLGQFSMIESMETGWGYAVTLPEDKFALALMLDKDTLKAEGLKDLEDFRRALSGTKHLSALLQPEHCLLEHRVVVAQSMLFERGTDDLAWLPVGDAASAYDPMAGIGIAKALDNGLRAAEAIQRWLAGDTQAITHYDAAITKAFYAFLNKRHHYYTQEPRWPQAAFWQRRQQWLNLHPEVVLVANPKQAVRVGQGLPKASLTTLQDLCRESRMAHEVIREFQQMSPGRYPDWRVVQALGYLLREGFVLAAEELVDR